MKEQSVQPFLEKLESQLDEFFNNKFPYQLSLKTKKSIARAMWLVALIFGILQLISAWNLWKWGHFADALADYIHTPRLGLFYYVSIAVIVASAILLLMGVSGLKVFQKHKGWDLVFYSALLNAAYVVVRIFSDYGGGIRGFLGAALVSALGAYLLFQIREFFLDKKPTANISK